MESLGDSAVMELAQRLRSLLEADPGRRRLLALVATLGLPDAWIAAGFVRSAVWDRLHGRPTSLPSSDVDVVWFDTAQEMELDRELEARLASLDPTVDWSVKNQAHMHVRNADAPYASATDAMRFWPETATAVAARVREDGTLEVAAPLGLDDLFGGLVRPTVRFRAEKRASFEARVRDKGWLRTWPGLRLVT